MRGPRMELFWRGSGNGVDRLENGERRGEDLAWMDRGAPTIKQTYPQKEPLIHRKPGVFHNSWGNGRFDSLLRYK